MTFFYHQLCDTLNNLNLDAWVISTKVISSFLFTSSAIRAHLVQLVAHTVATYSQSLDGFPERVVFGNESVVVSESQYELRAFI